MREGKGPGEGQSERQKIRIGQLGKGVGEALGQLINQGLPAVALSPKKQTNKINKNRPGEVWAAFTQGQKNEPDPPLEGKLLERLPQNTISGHGELAY